MGEAVDTLLVNEIFRSVQGEGSLIGQPSIFLRLALCNVNCPMCDTDYHQGVRVSRHDLVTAITGPYARGGLRHLVITGGEPYIHPGLTMFMEAVKEKAPFHITVETSGSIIPGTLEPVTLLSVSPKFCSLKAGQGKGLEMEDLRYSFMGVLDAARSADCDIQVKLVWNGLPEDVPEFLPNVIQELAEQEIPVYFQPLTKGADFNMQEYLLEFPWIVKAVQETFGPWPRVLPQMHKFFHWR